MTRPASKRGADLGSVSRRHMHSAAERACQAPTADGVPTHGAVLVAEASGSGRTGCRQRASYVERRQRRRRTRPGAASSVTGASVFHELSVNRWETRGAP